MTDYSNTDPGMVQFLDQFYSAELVGFKAIGLENARAMLDAFPDMVDLPAVEVGSVSEIEVAGAESQLPARLYMPVVEQANSPCLVFYHGGGWVMGGLESHDRLCRRLCKIANLPVIAIDYRLAPEHAFPAAVDDAQASFQWIYQNAGQFGLDKSRLAVGGDSAGGNIAASIALSLSGSPSGEPAFQLLIYPSLQPLGASPSHEKYAQGYGLDTADMQFFISSYVGSANTTSQDQRLWPLLAKSHKNVSPAYILTGGQDPIQDDGIEYAKVLQASGIPVKHVHYAGMTHGFCSMTALSPDALLAVEDAADYLGNALRKLGHDE